MPGSSRKTFVLAVLLGWTGVLLAGLMPLAAGQETDPFYRKRLESGEASYLAKSYEEAIRALDIAIFGLSKEKNLKARAYVFLALTRAALGQKEKSAENLNSAAALTGWDNLQTMDIRGGGKTELVKLIAGLRKDISPTQTTPPPPVLKTSVEVPTPPTINPPPPAGHPSVPPPSAGESIVDNLRRNITSNPRDPQPYYELSSYLRENRDPMGARKTLEDLLLQNPAEIRAHLEIGRLEYLARNLKSAEKSLEKFLALSGNVRIEARYHDEGRALLLLCAGLREDAKKIKKLLLETEDLFQPERFDALSLNAEDKERLRTLRTSQKK